MNNHNHLTSSDPTAPPPQPPPPQPPRSSFSCDRHPQEQFTGFCPSCLCERLTTLDHSSNSNTPSSSRRPSSASNAIKALFTSKPPALQIPKLSNPKPSSSFLPELRRSKSFSASKNEALFGGGGGGFCFEPQRKSCDVRVRSTLWSLFEQEKENKRSNLGVVPVNCDETSSSQDNRQNIVKKIEYSEPVLEETENVGDEDVVLVCNDEDDDDGGDEIRPVSETSLGGELEVSKNSSEIVEPVETVIGVGDLKVMKHYMDDNVGENQGKKGSGGGGFWSAASVFSKKWHKWRQKQKVKKKRNDTESLATLPVEKPISRQYRETQSEIADYGFGRRSCDTDPRFSLDAARISFDDPRYSFDEPRASWDGYLMGRSFPRMAPPMVSVLEDDAPPVHVPRSDMQIPVEDMNNEGIDMPGGSIQTKEYYADCSSRRRKSLDRSSSIRRTAASVVAEIDELKMASNTKVSPAAADSYFGAKVMVNGGGEFRDLSSHSLRDDISETFELGNVSRLRESSTTSSVMGNGERKESKKPKKWSWKLWGFMHRRNKDENDEDKYSTRASGVVGRSLSESWQDFRNGQANGDAKNGLFHRNMLRSNSSVSWRHANQIGGSFNSARKSSVELNGYARNKRRDEFGLERNRSARYSPNQVDNNGLLRFYLTPTSGGSRRGMLGKVKGSNGNNNSHSIARSVLRLY